MVFNKFNGFASRIVAGVLIASALIYPIKNTYAETSKNPQTSTSCSNHSEANPTIYSSLASKSIDSLTVEEKRTLVDRLVSIESQGDSNAVNIVIKERTLNGKVHIDTVYSVGESQINVSSHGALADYNQFHEPDFTPQDMFDPARNRIVRDWYLWTRIPQLLDEFKIQRTVANLSASYNGGVGKLKKRGGDAITNHNKLPKITQKYVEAVTGEEIK